MRTAAPNADDFIEEGEEEEESEEPIFRMKDGGPLFRSEVLGLLQLAADKNGVDKKRYAVHSFRIGGACALLHAGFSI